ncbi:MAG: sigma-70 family RNA polymerase sigma factor [Microgenomates group bacterium]|nr:sigma-70 family RNA polymerase sigma factor [Microgenomates group bacterium]
MSEYDFQNNVKETERHKKERHNIVERHGKYTCREVLDLCEKVRSIQLGIGNNEIDLSKEDISLPKILILIEAYQLWLSQNETSKEEMPDELEYCGNVAAELLLEGYDWLFKMVMRRFHIRKQWEEDPMQEARIGFLSKIALFDPEAGAKPSVAAYWDVFGRVIRYLQTQTTQFTISRHTGEIIRLIRKMAEELAAQGEDIDPKVIARRLNIDYLFVVRVLRYGAGGNIPINIVNEDDSDQSPPEETLVTNQPTPDDHNQLDTRDLNIQLLRLIETLDETTQMVLMLYYGLVPCGYSYTYKQIGSILGLARKDIQRILQNGLRQLRKRCHQLKPFR